MKENIEYQWTYSKSSDQFPLLYALHLIGGKWVIPIIWVLHDNGIVRYNEFKRSKYLTGVNNTMLVHCLRELEENGLVSRVNYLEVPPRVEYSLTEMGLELVQSLKPLLQWASKLRDNKSDISLSLDMGLLHE